MSRTLSLVRKTIDTAKYWRVVYDQESEDWNWQSRTVTMPLRQAPAVYGYSDVPDYKPDNYRVDESPLQNEYYRINNQDINQQVDGLGIDRCENYLFGEANALYNTPDATGFPNREYKTMSGNLLKELGWAYDGQGRSYLRFETLKPSDFVSHLSFETHPWLVHQYRIVMIDYGVTVTKPVINRNGYVYFFLTSRLGYAYIPERWIRPYSV